MAELSDSIYNWLYRGLSLKTAGILIGILLIAVHALALVKANGLQAWLKKVPRNKPIGVALLTVALLWALILLSSMDLGEFWKVRKIGLIALPILYGLVITYVDEFLSARALGILLLLAAAPTLDAAFLELPQSRLLLPILAYVWVIFGMFYVGMPYLMRDHVGWVTAEPKRWKILSLAGLLYGVLVLGCALAFWG